MVSHNNATNVITTHTSGPDNVTVDSILNSILSHDTVTPTSTSTEPQLFTPSSRDHNARPAATSTTRKRKKRRSCHRGRRRSHLRPRNNSINNVINLSDRNLTEHELSILSKGLKFVPTPTSVNRTELITDIKKWSRRMRLKEYFYDKNVPDNTQTNRFRLPSTWSPGIGRDKFLDCYINAVDKTILEGSSSNKKLRSNITKLNETP